MQSLTIKNVFIACLKYDAFYFYEAFITAQHCLLGRATVMHTPHLIPHLTVNKSDYLK